jgi:hypothetical protein
MQDAPTLRRVQPGGSVEDGAQGRLGDELAVAAQHGLEILAVDPRNEVRLALARRLAALLPGVDPRAQERLHAVTVAALERLALDQLATVREILAETLKDVAHVPEGLAATLAPAYVSVIAASMGLVMRRVCEPETIRKVCLYRRANRPLSPAAEGVAEQLRKRVAFRRAVKMKCEQVMAAGAKGVWIVCSGRLGGAEMSRVLKMRLGALPLTTLQAQIDYGTAESFMSYGTIGVKCWIFKGFYQKQEEQGVPEAVGTRLKGRGRR